MEEIREVFNYGLTPAEEAEFNERKVKKEFMKRWNMTPYTEAWFNDCSLHEVEVEFKNMKEKGISKFLEN